MPLFHVWFATKGRRWLLLGDVQESAKRELKAVASEKGIALLECEAIVDHVHLLLDVADRRRLPRVMNDLKGISSRRVFATFPELKMDAETEHFWQKGYGKKVVPPAALEATKRYIRTQWERLDGFER